MRKKNFKGRCEKRMIRKCMEVCRTYDAIQYKMDVEMYTFLNKGETSAYENTSENENGIYSIALTEDWIFPISGVTFSVGRKT